MPSLRSKHVGERSRGPSQTRGVTQLNLRALGPLKVAGGPFGVREGRFQTSEGFPDSGQLTPVAQTNVSFLGAAIAASARSR